MTDLANDLIIVFTFVEPTARTYGPYNKAGQAALKGKEKKLKLGYSTLVEISLYRKSQKKKELGQS